MNIWELHPALVHFPIAFLLGGVALDLYGRRSEPKVAAATCLLIAGLIAAAIAAAAGVVAFYTVPGNHTEEAHSLIYRHIGTSVVSVVLFAVVCYARWRRPSVVSPTIRWVGAAAAVFLIVGAAIGGRIVYQGGMGVEPGILRPDLHGHAAAAGPVSSPSAATGGGR